MTRLTLPASVFPDVLIANGVTYVALPMPGGLSIYASSANGFREMALFPAGSWPRFFAFANGQQILCAYKTADECLTVANVTTGEVTRTGIPAFWNSPICWRDDGLLCVQATSDAQVWSGVWPALPAPPAIRQGVGTGLAQWDGPNLMTWDEINAVLGPSSGSQPVIFSGLRTVGQANIGGIQVSIPTDGAEGVIAPGTYTNDPRPALAADGSISIVHWVQGSHGTLETVLYQDVTAADLKPAPPVMPTIPPFTTKKILASYDSGKAKGDNGSVIPKLSLLRRFDPHQETWWFDTEQGDRVLYHPCVAYADIKGAAQARVQLQHNDALAFNVYPTAGQSIDELMHEALLVMQANAAAGVFSILVGCAWNRLGTLSDQLVLDGMQAVRNLAGSSNALGIAWFGLNRGTSLGYFKPLYQQCVDLFVSPGWPDWPAPVPPPPQDAAALLLLKGLS